jgi:hypothetical protein
MRTAIALGLVLATAAACGAAGSHASGSGDGGPGSGDASGTDGSGDDSGGSSDGGSSDAGTPDWASLCTDFPSPDASTCPEPGLTCEYGSSPNPLCNTLALCASGGWETTEPTPACAYGACPASYAAVQQSATCPADPFSCSYPQGQCNCNLTSNGANPRLVWSCTTPAAGCPEPRPRLGSPCSQPNLSCDYGACSGGIKQICVNDIWVPVESSCP